MSETESQIAANLSTVKESIRESALAAGRNPDEVTLVAVSKTRSLEEVQQALNAGQTVFGENTVQDALTKIPKLKHTAAEWHFIGHLQSKKSGHIPGNFHWIHSVDSLKLARKLSNAVSQHPGLANLNCLLQVNVLEEESKFGLHAGEVTGFLHELLSLELPGLNWRGLMTIGAQGNEYQTRQTFTALRELQQGCRSEFELENFDQLSMGMTGDYRIAIEEGATLVRVGTAIFGTRDYHKR
jgi:pyridoxal phosphate enzyme (YggS family)